jgi:hypothetical protein
MLDAVSVELYAFSVFSKHWVPCTNGFDETAVAWAASVSNNNVVVRTLLGASAGETDLKSHFFFPLDNSSALTGNRLNRFYGVQFPL